MSAATPVPETAPAAAAPEKPKTVHVGAVISQELFQALEDHRWENRLNKSEVIVKAIEHFVKSQGK